MFEAWPIESYNKEDRFRLKLKIGGEFHVIIKVTYINKKSEILSYMINLRSKLHKAATSSSSCASNLLLSRVVSVPSMVDFVPFRSRTISNTVS